MDVWVDGRRIRLDPARALGKGGEADVYDIGGGKALKVYKTPDHPDLAGSPDEQRMAEARLANRQEKLRAFPPCAPSCVVVPERLATDRGGRRVLGYTMRLVAGAQPLARFAEPAFRDRGVSQETATQVLTRLHEAFGMVHAAGIVIGDANDQNVLVAAGEPHLIDADSFQFGPYPCDVFTDRFIDPLLCDLALAQPVPARPFTRLSDWYAFNVMLMQCLLCVGPYGGVYRPARRSRQVPHAARPLHRITVFDPDVVYPRPAVPYAVLPDDLLQHLHRVFAEDMRDTFPRRLLEGLVWTRCPGCGSEHARLACPRCHKVTTAPPAPPVEVRGRVEARTVLRTRGVVLDAGLDGGRLAWLTYEDGVFRREDGRVVLEGPLDPSMTLRVMGRVTLAAGAGRLVCLGPGAATRTLAVDGCGPVPAFDTDGTRLVWADGGRLNREGVLGPERIGDVLAGQTRLWLGPAFGLGFYRAGELSVAFVFGAERGGLDDSVRLPRLAGRLVDASATLSATRAWLLLATEAGGRIVHHALAIAPGGGIEGTAQAVRGDGSWLGAHGGPLATGDALLLPTDEGLVRVECRGGRIAPTRTFPDTHDFVDSGCRLVAAPDGLGVVGRQSITVLRLT